MRLLLYHIRNARLYPPNWRQLRKTMLSRASQCSFCGSKEKLEVHHVIPVHVDPTRAADMMNLIVLCSACHLRFGHLGDYKKFWDPSLQSRAIESIGHIVMARRSES